MGVVIEFFVERRTSTGWERAEPYVPGRVADDDDRRVSVLNAAHHHSRLAGLLLGSASPFPQRGFPDDASSEVAELWDFFGGEPVTWLTLSELNAFDWHGQMAARKIVATDFDQPLASMNEWAEGDPNGIRAVLWEI